MSRRPAQERDAKNAEERQRERGASLERCSDGCRKGRLHPWTDAHPLGHDDPVIGDATDATGTHARSGYVFHRPWIPLRPARPFASFAHTGRVLMTSTVTGANKRTRRGDRDSLRDLSAFPLRSPRPAFRRSPAVSDPALPHPPAFLCVLSARSASPRLTRVHRARRADRRPHSPQS